MAKLKSSDDFMYHIYIHMNDVDQFVIFSGLKFEQFITSVDPLRNLLLLKHNYQDGYFNMHTHLDFVVHDELRHFIRKVSDTKDLCWIDFADERKLNELSPREQADILYLSHKQEPVNSPFFHNLQNRYVYCASAKNKMTKIYFRHLSDADMLIANVFNALIKDKEKNVGFFRRRVKGSAPSITPEFLRAYRSYAKDGALFSLYKAEKTKSAYEIEVRNVAEYHFLDEFWDELTEVLKEPADEIIHIT